MDLSQDYAKDLRHIREILSHPAAEQYSIFGRVMRVYRSVGYSKIPYRFEIPQVIRAVPNSDEGWFDNLSKFGIAPPQKAALNRCNWDKKPLFYCSDDNAVTVFEVRAKKGDFVAISNWVNKENRPGEDTIPITFMALVLGVEKILDNVLTDNSFREILLKDDVLREETSPIVKDLDRYVGDLFSESSEGTQNLYLFTSAISKVLLERLTMKNGDKLQALMYPSVESNKTGINIVMTRNFFNTHLRLHGVSVYEVVDYVPVKKEYTLKPVKSLCGVREDGKPKWQRVHKKHDGLRSIFTPDTPAISFDKIKRLDLEDECE